MEESAYQTESESNDPMETSPTEEGDVNRINLVHAKVDDVENGSERNGVEYVNNDSTVMLHDGTVSSNNSNADHMSTDCIAKDSPDSNLEIKGFDSCAVEEARYAIELLRGDDVAGRISAVQRLDSIAAVLGERRTREELIPFFNGKC